MNIIWDFRLFSYGYRDRGVGVFATRMTKAILDTDCTANIYIWGEKEKMPEEFLRWPVHWVHYKPRSWKSDLVVIPMLILKYHIDIFHYWIALGPNFRIGLGLFHPCKTVCTIHDCGVVLWDDVPQCAAVRKTWYWKTQKVLFAKSDSIVCNSHATLSDVEKLFKRASFSKTVIYTPLPNPVVKGASVRKKQFIMVSGPRHKNAANAIKAFELFKRKYPEFTFSIFGDCPPEEIKKGVLAESGIRLEPMSGYFDGLVASAGLIYCSFHEGLGLPPLEAMSTGCPIVLSDLPALHETCGEAGLYVDPRTISSIAQGMEDVACNQDIWSQKSLAGGVRYREKSGNAGREWLTLYNDLT